MVDVIGTEMPAEFLVGYILLLVIVPLLIGGLALYLRFRWKKFDAQHAERIKIAKEKIIQKRLLHIKRMRKKIISTSTKRKKKRETNKEAAEKRNKQLKETELKKKTDDELERKRIESEKRRELIDIEKRERELLRKRDKKQWASSEKRRAVDRGELMRAANNNETLAFATDFGETQNYEEKEDTVSKKTGGFSQCDSKKSKKGGREKKIPSGASKREQTESGTRCDSNKVQKRREEEEERKKREEEEEKKKREEEVDRKKMEEEDDKLFPPAELHSARSFASRKKGDTPGVEVSANAPSKKSERGERGRKKSSKSKRSDNEKKKKKEEDKIPKK